MNLQMPSDSIDDDDEFAEFEGRPVLVWFLMAVALVAMAFLLGSAPEAVAKPVANSLNPSAVAITSPAAVTTSRDLAFGG